MKIGWYGWYDLLKPLHSKAFSIPTIKKKGWYKVGMGWYDCK